MAGTWHGALTIAATQKYAGYGNSRVIGMHELADQRGSGLTATSGRVCMAHRGQRMQGRWDTEFGIAAPARSSPRPRRSEALAELDCGFDRLAGRPRSSVAPSVENIARPVRVYRIGSDGENLNVTLNARPRALLPVLRLDDGTTIDDTAAICRYFESRSLAKPSCDRSRLKGSDRELAAAHHS
jgi:hypothetical protein